MKQAVREIAEAQKAGEAMTPEELEEVICRRFEADRRGFARALGLFIALALQGVVIDPDIFG